ncbi:TonB-dependent receptor [Dyadobacter arcticus]|uniref:Iron complex outermembrane receptor protein n=1 Tax=Dyadobacter arcticus TaxID=1078754 RepID=A0ABX0UPG9_9BACT|nr:TonB-dependent receptor [Dyadobacter arcticus]NIJ54887.1 iron complex outermembrane receptor protein [Dyadobacter arcticus]
MQKISIPGLLVAIPIFANSATSQIPVDTLKARELQEITINAFESRADPLTTTATVGLLTSRTLERFSTNTWANAVNTVPGVKMEERSPGSYRFSVRGSLIRSPFGVRNVKFYWNGIPFTDASGNTPLNSLDYNAVQGMEIIKGPGSSIYGAGTGGVVLLQSHPDNNLQNRIEQSISFGKYGFQSRNSTIQVGDISIQYGHSEQDGYRNHSGMTRDAIRFTSSSKVGDGTLSLLGIYSDLYYETPGGINLAQYQNNPKLARQSTANVPGSEAQQAAIYTKLALLGGNYILPLSDTWTQSTALYLTYTDFANPFITNYEKRDENGIGGRNIWQNRAQICDIKTNWTSGFEWQYGKSAQRNYDNIGGRPDKQQTVEDLRTTNLSVFSQLEAVFFTDLTLSAGVSYNTFKYKYERFVALPYNKDKKNFDGIFVPRFAANKVIGKNWAVIASYSGGFSPPTLQEVRPSAGGFRKALEAERGANAEVGIRRLGKRITGELSLYHFGLKETIVRRTNEAGAEFFINAGKTRQKGLEWSIAYEILSDPELPLILKLWNTGTWTRYTFEDLKQGEVDLSGKLIPGIPRLSQTSGLDALFKYGFSAYITYQYGGSFFLNDANTVKNTAYNQWIGRISWKKSWGQHFYSELSVSAEKVNAGIYSLGYDLNAFGNRYYNGAPKDNLWAGVKVGWEWQKSSK